VNKNVNKLVVQ